MALCFGCVWRLLVEKKFLRFSPRSDVSGAKSEVFGTKRLWAFDGVIIGAWCFVFVGILSRESGEEKILMRCVVMSS